MIKWPFKKKEKVPGPKSTALRTEQPLTPAQHKISARMMADLSSEDAGRQSRAVLSYLGLPSLTMKSPPTLAYLYDTLIHTGRTNPQVLQSALQDASPKAFDRFYKLSLESDEPALFTAGFDQFVGRAKDCRKYSQGRYYARALYHGIEEARKPLESLVEEIFQYNRMPAWPFEDKELRKRMGDFSPRDTSGPWFHVFLKNVLEDSEDQGMMDTVLDAFAESDNLRMGWDLYETVMPIIIAKGNEDQAGKAMEMTKREWGLKGIWDIFGSAFYSTESSQRREALFEELTSMVSPGVDESPMKSYIREKPFDHPFHFYSGLSKEKDGPLSAFSERARSLLPWLVRIVPEIRYDSWQLDAYKILIPAIGKEGLQQIFRQVEAIPEPENCTMALKYDLYAWVKTTYGREATPDQAPDKTMRHALIQYLGQTFAEEQGTTHEYAKGLDSRYVEYYKDRHENYEADLLTKALHYSAYAAARKR